MATSRGGAAVTPTATAKSRGVSPESFFLSVGTRDPLLDDSRRMKAALDRRGVACDLEIYPGEPHAFHALVLRESARRCWLHHFDFLARHL